MGPFMNQCIIKIMDCGKITSKIGCYETVSMKSDRGRKIFQEIKNLVNSDSNKSNSKEKTKLLTLHSKKGKSLISHVG